MGVYWEQGGWVSLIKLTSAVLLADVALSTAKEACQLLELDIHAAEAWIETNGYETEATLQDREAKRRAEAPPSSSPTHLLTSSPAPMDISTPPPPTLSPPADVLAVPEPPAEATDMDEGETPPADVPSLPAQAKSGRPPPSETSPSSRSRSSTASTGPGAPPATNDTPPSPRSRRTSAPPNQLSTLGNVTPPPSRISLGLSSPTLAIAPPSLPLPLPLLQSITLFVIPLAASVTQIVLQKLFSPFGSIKDCRIARDRKGRRRDFAFVTFEAEEDGLAAQQALHGSQLGDKVIQVTVQQGDQVSPPAHQEGGRWRDQDDTWRPSLDGQSHPDDEEDVSRRSGGHRRRARSSSLRRDTTRDRSPSPSRHPRHWDEPSLEEVHESRRSGKDTPSSLRRKSSRSRSPRHRSERDGGRRSRSSRKGKRRGDGAVDCEAEEDRMEKLMTRLPRSVKKEEDGLDGSRAVKSSNPDATSSRLLPGESYRFGTPSNGRLTPLYYSNATISHHQPAASRDASYRGQRCLDQFVRRRRFGDVETDVGGNQSTRRSPKLRWDVGMRGPVAKSVIRILCC